MIWIGIGCLSLFALLPAATAFWLRGRAQDERSAALALHEAQLTELERDLSIGMIAPAEHTIAKLEIQRRILAADRARSDISEKSARARAIVALALIPFIAIGLYLTGGHPTMPGQPLKPRLAEIKARDAKGNAAIDQLRVALTKMSPTDPTLRQGYLLLGQAEAARGRSAAAAEAWRHALDLGFAPELAAEVAEEQTMADGHISADSLALYRRALDAAPKDAPWRESIEQRIAQGEHDQEQP
ncbi:c-type cytochrome biogenesis protein CcmI [Acetobacter sacchari]|uniref:C-type cytochrome biogenesis protein CcmI n=1 Tax=Acetobacter sacchari TaxID=2661687 RepID=A0ABS3LTN0_9PROT|nr:c-type cytochrome biogenesis protein CcmI [Acetobacter sacchari]MBO1359265.1 c-type cytochrome biogenesis protein CcmI [Acetobacter sacchari]